MTDNLPAVAKPVEVDWTVASADSDAFIAEQHRLVDAGHKAQAQELQHLRNAHYQSVEQAEHRELTADPFHDEAYGLDAVEVIETARFADPDTVHILEQIDETPGGLARTVRDGRSYTKWFLARYPRTRDALRELDIDGSIIEAVSRKYPHSADALDARDLPTLPAGASLGDHPVFIAAAATRWRKLADAEKNIGQSKGKQMDDDQQHDPVPDLRAEHHRLSGEILRAMDQGDRIRARELQHQRDIINARMPNGPIVGSQGRRF